MDCCTPRASKATPPVAGAYNRLPTMSRRTLLKGAVMLSGAAALSACGIGGGGGGRDQIQLAFCSQLLCVVPYEFTNARGHFADEGLDVELVYSQGGGAALQALVGGAVDYAATSLDAAVQAVAGGGDIRRFASTGRLPLFALATSPGTADEITDIEDLRGKTVAVSALGNADHTILLYLLDRAAVHVDDVEIATIGTNIYDVLRVGDVDAGMVQEPALTLLQRDGGSVLVNLMELADAEEAFGGPYEFMGVSVRTGEIEERSDEMRRLSRALEKGLEDTRTAPVAELVDALPAELIAGEDRGQMEATLEAYRESLYPSDVTIDVDAVQRVLDSLEQAGELGAPITPDDILDLSILQGA
jgi:NitT/TauT family transport system substrate-binding protein